MSFNNTKKIEDDVKEVIGKYDLKQHYKMSNSEIEKRNKNELILYKYDGDGNPVYLTRKKIKRLEKKR